MRIGLIRPSMGGKPCGDTMESLALLAALTPAEHTCVCFDERVEKLTFSPDMDLVALSVDTFSARRAYDITAEYRRLGIPVVMGGYHPTLIPEEAAENADAVVTGDAETVWQQVLADVQCGRLKRRYDGGCPPLAGIRFDRRIFAGKRYRRLRLIQVGRGCHHGCAFCAVNAFYGSTYRHRPTNEVLTEIAEANGQPIFFADDNLFTVGGRFRDLLAGLRRMDARWGCQISLDAAGDEGLVHAMAEAGCFAVMIGFESLNPDSLRQMGKAWNLKGGDYGAQLAALHAHGILIYGSFVFGLDHDTVDAFPEAVAFAMEHRLFLANFNPLTPMPGTTIYQKMKDEGRLTHDPWWLNPSYRYGDTAFNPRGMTADELTDGCWRARRAFTNWRNTGLRLWRARGLIKSPWKAGLFALANIVNRRELRRKQGQALA